MSLINRMLDDLAARQAPGTESLQGVRLNDPLEAASQGLGRGKLAVLMLVIAAIPGLSWWLWPSRVEIPVPQARSAPPTPAATVAESPAPPSAPAPPQADAPAPQLQLAQQLSSIEAAAPISAPDAPAVVDDAERVERAQTNAPTPPPAPKAIRSKPEPKTQPPAQAEAQPVATPSAPAAAPVEPAVERKQRARQALADQDPAAALQILSSTDAARDVESDALRAAALQRLGRHGEAADAYAALTARDPAEPGHWVGLGISLEGLLRREPARMAYRRALQSDRLAPSLRAFALDRITVLETP